MAPKRPDVRRTGNQLRRTRVTNRLPALGPLVVTTILVGFTAAAVAQYAHFWYGVGRRPEGSSFASFLFRPDDATWIRPEFDQYQPGISTWPHVFGDLFDVWLHGFEPNPYTRFIFGPSLYPPLLQLVTGPWHRLPYGWVVLLFMVICTGLWLWLSTRMLRKLKCPSPFGVAFVVLFFTLPLTFALDRGNVEALVSLALPVALLGAVGTSATRSERPWPLVLAGMLKISPIALLGVVHWHRRTLIQALIVFTGLAVLSVVALALMSGNPVDTGRSYLAVVTSYSPGSNQMFEFRASFWGVVVAWMTVLRFDPSPAYAASQATGVIMLAVLLTCGLLAAVLPLHLWERVALVSSALMLWSSDGPMYRELYLVTALVLLLGKCWRSHGVYPMITGLLIACVVAPKPTIATLPWFGTLSTGTPIILLEVLIVTYGAVRLWRLRRRDSRVGATVTI